MEKISIAEKFRTFEQYWQSKVIGEFNRQYIKIAKLKGEFEWHYHKTEDELFIVIKGQLSIKFHDQEIILKEGEMLVVPGDIQHKLFSQEEVQILVIEPKSILNIGNIQGEPAIENA